MKRIFEYARHNELFEDNLMSLINTNDYADACRAPKDIKTRSFSEDEVQMLQEEVQVHEDNVHALMVLFDAEVGIRRAEVCALHKADISDDYLHVHRQLVRRGKPQKWVELQYTKDEHQKEGGLSEGRIVILTERAQEIISKALALPGDSEYLFHDKDGNPVKPDSFNQYFRRHRQHVDCTAANNHGLRYNYNSNLIGLGLDVAERATLMGHSVEVKEKVYSNGAKRKVEKIRDKILSDQKK